MNAVFVVPLSTWNTLLTELLEDYEVFAPLAFGENIEYEKLTEHTLPEIIYNRPKPTSPLKTFFLPVKENVVAPRKSEMKRIIIGAPACDLSGLSILDEIYLDKEYTDPNYSKHRENTLLFGFDCHSVQEHCHCNSYEFSAVPEANTDVLLSKQDEQIIVKIISGKGEEFFAKYLKGKAKAGEGDLEQLSLIRKEVSDQLAKQNKDIPNYKATGKLVSGSTDAIWEKYADDCVSCGACSAICPTCSCFLFIERPEFEKVRSLDTCQYPGFEKVAAGEDPLRQLPLRFRNRYNCKYVWKPQKFTSKACTGCGRCIEACIGNINKNELFRELSN